MTPCGVPETRPRLLISGFQAADSYWSIKPPRIGRRRILPWTGSGTGVSGRGGRSCSEAGLGVGPAENGDLVAEDEELDVLDDGLRGSSVCQLQ